MTTTQSTSKLEPGNVAKVAMRVDRLRSVTQTRGSFVTLGEAGDEPYGASMALPEWQFERKSDDVLVARGQFALVGERSEAVEGSSEFKPAGAFVQIEAEFVAEYLLSPGESFSDDDAIAFANVNGTLNVHPFWREFVYSCLMRANLPPLLLPPFNPIKAGMLVRRKPEPAASTEPPKVP